MGTVLFVPRAKGDGSVWLIFNIRAIRDRGTMGTVLFVPLFLLEEENFWGIISGAQKEPSPLCPCPLWPRFLAEAVDCIDNVVDIIGRNCGADGKAKLLSCNFFCDGKV